MRWSTGRRGEERRGESTSSGMMSGPQGNEAPGEGGNMSGNAQQGEAAMSSPVASMQPAVTTETEDESEDESEILEESPCGRWQKRREEVRASTCGPQHISHPSILYFTCFVP